MNLLSKPVTKTVSWDDKVWRLQVDEHSLYVIERLMGLRQGEDFGSWVTALRELAKDYTESGGITELERKEIWHIVLYGLTSSYREESNQIFRLSDADKVLGSVIPGAWVRLLPVDRALIQGLQLQTILTLSESGHLVLGSKAPKSKGRVHQAAPDQQTGDADSSTL